MPIQTYESLLSFVDKCHERFGVSVGMGISSEVKYNVVEVSMSDAVAVYGLRYRIQQEKAPNGELINYKNLVENLKGASEKTCRIHIILSRFEKKHK